MLRSGNALTMYDLLAGSIIFSYTQKNVEFTDISFSADDQIIVSGDSEGNIHVLDAKSGDCKNVYKAHDGRVKTIEFSPY